MCPQFNPDFRPFAVKYLALCHFRAILALSSMVVRPVVLQDPPKHPFPAQLPFNNSSRSLSPLDAALTQVLILRHLKSFKINTYTKTRGECPSRSPQVCQLITPPSHAQTRHFCHRHFACKPFSINRLRTLSITNRGGGAAPDISTTRVSIDPYIPIDAYRRELARRMCYRPQ